MKIECVEGRLRFRSPTLTLWCGCIGMPYSTDIAKEMQDATLSDAEIGAVLSAAAILRSQQTETSKAVALQLEQIAKRLTA